MNIYIKSFARAYYLDKCLESIETYVDGSYNIIVLDDGTDPVYLSEIQLRHPMITIIKSPLYAEKVEKIRNHIKSNDYPIGQLMIPSQFWKDSLNESGGYFLLLEDDMWLCNHINLDEIEHAMRQHSISMVKTTTFGTDIFAKYHKGFIVDDIIEIIPRLKFKSSFVFRKIFAENFLKSHSILSRLNLVNSRDFFSIYAIYMVAGAFYEKDYYSHLWGNFDGMVNENYQLANVISWVKKHPEKRYAILENSALKTSLSSSATNCFANIDFDPFVYNHILNEEWLTGRFGTDRGATEDFDKDTIIKILVRENHPKASAENWKKWVQRFSGQYEKLGFTL